MTETAHTPDSEILPVLALRDGVLFPGVRCRVLLTTVRAYGAIVEASRARDRPALAVFATRRTRESDPDGSELFEVGALASVVGLERSGCCGRWIADIAAHARVRTTARLRERPFRIDRVEALAEPAEDATVIGALIDAVRIGSRRMRGLPATRCSDVAAVIRRLHETADATQVVGAAMELFPTMPLPEQQRALELGCSADRLAFVLGKMSKALADPGPGSARARLS